MVSRANVRTDLIDGMVNYIRQSDMGISHDRLHRQHCIIGCGGIGYWTAIFLAMLGATQITIVDHDVIEATNLPRLPIPLRYRGKLKTLALKATIRLLRPTVKVTAIPMKVNE